MEQFNFLFSVVVPIYNTEQYLQECIDSVINQTIGFEKIQLILINSASTDSSEEICRTYCETYPEQIKYIKLIENRGPSSARNVGLDCATGKYVVFLDSDDKYRQEAFERAYDFFQKHDGEIDYIACRIQNFDAYGGWHALDYIFKSDRVVNVWDEYDCIKTTIPAFIKREAIGTLRIDESVYHNEDTKFATQIIMQKMKYGVLRSCVYMYRRRRIQTSIQQTVKNTEHYYTDAVNNVLFWLIDYSKQKFYKVIPFVQFVVMYSVQWRLLDAIPDWMTQEQLDLYKENIRQILLQIDDYIILEQRNIYKEYKIFCLRLKYGEEVYTKFRLLLGKILFNNLTWCTVDNRSILNYWWHGVENNNIMKMTGEINFPFPHNDYEIYAQDNSGNQYPFEFDIYAEKKKLSLGEVCLTIRPFVVRIPLVDVSTIQIILRYQGVTFPLYINAGKFSNLSLDPPESYFRSKNYLFTRNSNTIFIESYSTKNARKRKMVLWKALFKRKDRRAIICRLCAALLRKLSKRQQDVRIFFGNERVV